MKFHRLIAAAAVTLSALTGAHAQEVRMGYVPIEAHPVGQGINRFAELVKAKTNGRIAINTYCCGKIGNEPQLQTMLQGGTLQLMVGPTPNLVGSIKEFGIFDLPFFFANFKEVDAIMDGPVGADLFKKMEGIGLVGLAYWDNGFRHMTNSKRRITKAEDIEGLKIRVIPNPVFINTFRALKANPVPMPYPELYNALESKAVDAQETPVGLIHSTKFYEVTKYMTMTGHAYTAFFVAASKRWFDSLPAADQQAIRDAARESQAYQRGLSRDAAERLTRELRDQHGMDVVTLPPAEMAKLREMVKPVVAQFSEVIGADLIKQAREDMAKAK